MTTTIRSELRTLERGIRQKWDIPDEVLRMVPMRMLGIMAKGKDRDSIAAAKVLAALNAQNNPPELAQAPQINVGVKVENNQSSDAGRTLASEVVERIRTARISADNSGRLA